MTIGDLVIEALRQHLRSGTRPVLPEGGALVWEWFCDLSTARSYHWAGPNPIAWQDIAAYAALMRLPIQPRHAALIRRLDRAFLDHFAQQASNATPATSVASASPMTPGLFDAMFG